MKSKRGVQMLGRARRALAEEAGFESPAPPPPVLEATSPGGSPSSDSQQSGLVR